MKWILLVIIGISLTACFKSEEFPSVPEIEFVSFEPMGDSAVITLNFQDGEGDIGLLESDTLSPYDIASKYYYNLYLEYFEKTDDNGWQIGKDFNGDSIVFKTRIQPVYSGKPKGIKGVIEYTLEPFYFNPFSSDSDTIKYRIQLIDRALNESDWIETQPLIQ